ncbi:hypothetical protein ACEN2D_02190 [Corynebacterium auriscanis]|uniref:hypothetical protein n=1 Tax=Corynebacterium TaxID=1716 RepID=UPI000ADC4AFA|nr:hypothetical protein [Corynebacterium sp. HMSC28B08]
MATVKKNTAVSNDVEIVEKNDAKETTKSPTFVGGVYTEHDVELTNGAKVDVEVIVDKRQLPATYGSLLSEANGPAIIMATLTARTRRILDWAGATLADIEDVLPGVINRGQEFSEDN